MALHLCRRLPRARRPADARRRCWEASSRSPCGVAAPSCRHHCAARCWPRCVDHRRLCEAPDARTPILSKHARDLSTTRAVARARYHLSDDFLRGRSRRRFFCPCLDGSGFRHVVLLCKVREEGERGSGWSSTGRCGDQSGDCEPRSLRGFNGSRAAGLVTAVHGRIRICTLGRRRARAGRGGELRGMKIADGLYLSASARACGVLLEPNPPAQSRHRRLQFGGRGSSDRRIFVGIDVSDRDLFLQPRH